jgi:uncharacterized membrane protein YphA (DoxX/SURF4 family)
MRVILHIARILVGLTFIFSGFVKGIDPWGSAYKFSDYFTAMHLDWLQWAAFPLGVLLSFAEVTIGVALVFNVFLKVFSLLALIFMIFFTGLTFWIALENPVTDCGCFGDALVISNWETFYKNVVLLILTILIFYYRRYIKNLPPEKTGYFLSGIALVAYAVIVIHSYNHLPVIDFRPFKVGTNLSEAMSVPEGAPQDEYENVFYYTNKNTGEVKQFTEENYPWQDTLNWEFHDMESFLVTKGYQPPIHDFRIETLEGEDILDFFLYDENFVFMVIAWNLQKSHTESQDEINILARWAMDNGMQFIGLTSSLPDESQEYIEKYNVPYEFFNTDEITLKTIIRSNPGLMVIKNGTVVAKYHYNDMPSPGEFEKEFINK